MVVDDLRSTTYDRAAGALEMVTPGIRSTVSEGPV